MKHIAIVVLLISSAQVLGQEQGAPLASLTRVVYEKAGFRSFAASNTNPPLFAVNEGRGGDYYVSLVDAKGKVRDRFPHQARISCVALSRDGKYLASSSTDQHTIIWDVEEGKQLQHYNDEIRAMAFSPDGKSLAMWVPGRVDIIDVASGKVKHAFHRKVGVSPASFSHDGKYFAAPAGKGQILVWSLETGKLHAALQAPSKKYTWCVAFFPKSNRLVSGGEHVVLWDVDAKKQLHVFKDYPPGAATVAVSPDEKLLATGSGDAYLWNLQTKKLRGRFPRLFPFGMYFSADGKKLYTGGTNYIQETTIPEVEVFWRPGDDEE